MNFADGYISFLNKAKTEREFIKEAEKMVNIYYLKELNMI